MRKILLLVCIAFVVLCYGYPCFILPIGEYTHSETSEVLGVEVTNTYSVKFGFDGKAKVSYNNIDTEYNYKLDGNHVILSLDEEFGNSDDTEMIIDSIYRLGEAVNPIGLWTTVGIGVLAILMIVTIPNKR